MPAHQKTPLVTLKLSSPSFLDSAVNDDVTPHPLYCIKTVGLSTSISRSDPWEGLSKVADIKWPQAIPAKGKGKGPDSILVQIKGSLWQDSETILKPASFLSAPRKFNIPHYSQSLKWKRTGSSYSCISSAVKGVIATFDPAVESVPPRLRIYQTIDNKDDVRPLFVHHGVSVALLDYLLLTSLLLVTDIQEWMVVKKYEDNELDHTNDVDLDAPLTPPPRTSLSTSPSQWRKIVYGEPLFGKRVPRTASNAASENVALPTPTSSDQMAKIIYGEPLYPRLRSASLAPDVEDEDDTVDTVSSSGQVTPSSPAESGWFDPPPHRNFNSSFHQRAASASSHSHGTQSSIHSQISRPSTSVGTPTSMRGRDFFTASSHRSLAQLHPSSRLADSIYSSEASQSVIDIAPLPPPSPLLLSSASSLSHDDLSIYSQSTRRVRPLPQLPSQLPLNPARTPHTLRQVQSQTLGPLERHASGRGRRSLPPTPGQRQSPKPPNAGSNRPACQHDCQHRYCSYKNINDNLSQWISLLTDANGNISLPPLPGAPFDQPPPAYDGLNFNATLEPLHEHIPSHSDQDILE